MKLMKSTSAPCITEEQVLVIENEFLRDEIEFASLEHDLELCQTVLKCIEEEGCVSKSVEVMFGESFTDIANAKAELEQHVESISNELLDKLTEWNKTKDVFGIMDAMVDKFAKLTVDDVKNLKYPLDGLITDRIRRVINFFDICSKLESTGPETEEEFKKSVAQLKELFGKVGSHNVNAEVRDEVEMKTPEQLIDTIKRCKTYLNAFKDNFRSVLKDAARVKREVVEKFVDPSIVNKYRAEAYRVSRIGMRLVIDAGRVLMNKINASKAK